MQCLINTYKTLHAKSMQKYNTYTRYKHNHYEMYRLNNLPVTPKQSLSYAERPDYLPDCRGIISVEGIVKQYDLLHNTFLN